ncbi:Gamma-glutamyltranspeptidase 1 [Pleurostoma richardsiae]|uniref:Glutathione hydrolase n=1 Tax=Pleurostoma richardsiae TaxID=41990 RepID=A0AA38VGE5_9PEZI|nr:Gamma-glutamyltranspeptidase 1 [Pleurostoma richardsiae]
MKAAVRALPLHLLSLYGAGLVDALPLQALTLPVSGSKGAVASESSICSQIGIDLLERGGNAADAMVGTMLCVGTIGMYHSGLGGGGFTLVRDADGNYEAIDFREMAPAAAYEDMYHDDYLSSLVGGLAVAVPGELRGLEYLHRKYGALPWRAVVHPAVHVARNGFNVTEDLVRYMTATLEEQKKAGRGNFLLEDPAWAEDFAPNGTLVTLGDVITRKRYADTLEKIGRDGIDTFYEGEIAKSIVEAVQATGGAITLDDMKNYTIHPKKAIHITYRGHKLYSTGAPSSGPVMLSMLKTMEQYDPLETSDVNLTTHRFIEAMRFAYAARFDLGDPDFVSDAVPLEHDMLSEQMAQRTRSRINDNATLPVDAYDPKAIYTPDSHGTSHIVTADSSGLTVSTTTTINMLFGSQVMTPDTGIILNNEMNDFSVPGVRNGFGFEPSEANYIRARKRPMSSITPIVAEHANGTVLFVTGAAGGSRIISSTTQVAWRMLELGEDVVAALAAPRFHDQLMPNEVTIEWMFDNSTVDGIQAKGHNVTWVRPGISAVQGIRKLWDGTFEAAGEPRQRNSGGFSI